MSSSIALNVFRAIFRCSRFGELTLASDCVCCESLETGSDELFVAPHCVCCLGARAGDAPA